MIKISDNIVRIINPDGTEVEFELEELEGKIVRSCLAAGERNAWIAEDIALSVEYALSRSENQQHIFALSDVNALVIKVLQQIGFPEVAQAFKSENATAEVEVLVDYNTISDLLNRHLALNGQRLKQVASTVIRSAKMLNITKASPVFFVELGKVISKSSLASSRSLDVLKFLETEKFSSWALGKNEILTALNTDTLEIIEENIIKIVGVSNLFPAIKIDFTLVKMIEKFKLQSPLTEMALTANFPVIAEAIDDIVKTINSMVLEVNSNSEWKDAPLPVYLNVVDMSQFAQEHLFYSWPQAAGDCREMIAFLEKMLSFSIFKVRMK